MPLLSDRDLGWQGGLQSLKRYLDELRFSGDQDVDVVEWLAERGISVDPSTIYDWVHAFTPRFIEAARRHRHAIGRKWRVDETLFKIGGRWCYAFCAIDEDGQIVDVLLSKHRDAASARAFSEQAITRTNSSSRSFGSRELGRSGRPSGRRGEWTCLSCWWRARSTAPPPPVIKALLHTADTGYPLQPSLLE